MEGYYHFYKLQKFPQPFERIYAIWALLGLFFNYNIPVFYLYLFLLLISIALSIVVVKGILNAGYSQGEAQAMCKDFTFLSQQPSIKQHLRLDASLSVLVLLAIVLFTAFANL